MPEKTENFRWNNGGGMWGGRGLLLDGPNYIPEELTFKQQPLEPFNSLGEEHIAGREEQCTHGGWQRMCTQH